MDRRSLFETTATLGLGALAGCEMGLKLAGVKLAGSGVQAAMDHFSSHAAATPLRQAA